MAPELLTFCGFRCDLCPAYKKNVEKLASSKEVSEGWQKYLGYTVSPEGISCVGCRSIGKHLDADCPVRPCVLQKKFETCADCDEFETCEKLKTRADAIEPIKNKFKGNLSDREYTLFIMPYEGRIRLLKIRGKKK